MEEIDNNKHYFCTVGMQASLQNSSLTVHMYFYWVTVCGVKQYELDPRCTCGTLLSVSLFPVVLSSLIFQQPPAHSLDNQGF